MAYKPRVSDAVRARHDEADVLTTPQRKVTVPVAPVNNPTTRKNRVGYGYYRWHY